MTHHVTPINDVEQHMESSTCNCNPKSEILENGDIMITHNSFDGRKLIERLIDEVNQED